MSSLPRPPPSLQAPGASQAAHPVHAPGRHDPRPAVDDRLVAPESHAEIVDGVVYRTMGANPPHTIEHGRVTHVLSGCLAEGYEGAVDMLTRSDEDTDAAPDVSVFPTGLDPITKGRRLEEIAFEVLDSERMSHATTKVKKLAAHRSKNRVIKEALAQRQKEGSAPRDPRSVRPRAPRAGLRAQRPPRASLPGARRGHGEPRC